MIMDERMKEYLDNLVWWEQINILIVEKRTVIRKISQLRCRLLEIIDDKEREQIKNEIEIHRETLIYIETVRKKLIDIIHSLNTDWETEK